MDNNEKRFQIRTIVSLGCKGLELGLEGQDRDQHQIELVSFMLGKDKISKFMLEHMRASISEEIRRQFPGINFDKIQSRFAKKFEQIYDPKTNKYKQFLESLENSFGETRIVQQVNESFVYPPPHFYTLGTCPELYVCAICKTSNVKLWRPWGDSEPLICAKCAEGLQAPHEYDVITCWKPMKFPNGHDGWQGVYEYEDAKKTKIKRLPMEKWVVNESGDVPSYIGSPGPDGVWGPMTDQLSLNLKGVFKDYTSGSTTVIPSIPNSDGSTWCYTTVPEEGCIWWKNLPTHKTE